MSGVELANLLGNRRWLERDEPFPHVVARDVFARSTYDLLEQSFLDRLAARANGNGGWSHVRNYDASGLQFQPDLAGPLRLFISRDWHDLLARVFAIRATGDLNSGLHYHEPGSADGAIHHDLNAGWFVDYPSEDGIHLARHDLCDYVTGEPRASGAMPRRTVRAVAMIFFLANEPWSAGDGGETGLYRSEHDVVGEPWDAVPPINNSMLLFECTPWSFHGFLSNRRHPRGSVILWIHRPVEDVVDLWGERAIGRWAPERGNS